MLTRRLAALLVLAVAVLVLPRPLYAELTAAEKVDMLAGPTTSLGTPASIPTIAAFDALLLKQALYHAERFPLFPDQIDESNFYDFALMLYQTYYRTGDPYYLAKAREVAVRWRDEPLNQNIHNRIYDPTHAGPTPQPWFISTLGIAVHALETGDPESRRIVDDQAQYMWYFWPNNPADPRVAGYTLMAMIAAIMLGDAHAGEYFDHLKHAKQNVNTYITQQSADGCWMSNPPGYPSPVSINFQQGITMEALILYDRYIGDPRILPAIQRCTAWLWNTQWNAAKEGFQYANYNWVANGSGISTDITRELSGLKVMAWGYLYERTNDPAYKLQGDAIMAGLIKGSTFLMKQTPQMFRTPMRYAGYVALQEATPPPPPRPSVTLSGTFGWWSTITVAWADLPAPTTIGPYRFVLAFVGAAPSAYVAGRSFTYAPSGSMLFGSVTLPRGQYEIRLLPPVQSGFTAIAVSQPFNVP